MRRICSYLIDWGHFARRPSIWHPLWIVIQCPLHKAANCIVVHKRHTVQHLPLSMQTYHSASMHPTLPCTHSSHRICEWISRLQPELMLSLPSPHDGIPFIGVASACHHRFQHSLTKDGTQDLWRNFWLQTQELWSLWFMLNLRMQT